jgi:glycerol-3-phosphate dehydrogenase
VDRIVEREGREAPCRTHEIPLGMPMDAADLAGGEGVDQAGREHLVSRYGHAAHDVLKLVDEAPELGERICAELPDIVAEATFAARREQARGLPDVLLRRTRTGLTCARSLCSEGDDGAHRAALALGGELGWDAGRVAQEVEAWRSVARAEGLVPGWPEEPPHGATGNGRPEPDAGQPLREGAAPEEPA